MVIGGLLRDTFALLLREKQGQPSTLGDDAARTIRRRVALRWAGGLAGLAVMGSLGVAALAGIGDGRDADVDAVIASPIPTPTLGSASATFPLTGGPEFVSASAHLSCGEVAPQPHPVDRGIALDVIASDTATSGIPEGVTSLPPTVSAALAQTSTDDLGEVATSGIDLLVIQDGIIKGVFQGKDVALGGAFARPGDANGAIPLVSDWARCPPLGSPSSTGVDPGTYELMAIARVFSTPESVALYQALGYSYGARYLNPGNIEDPAAIYLPGSYDCKQLAKYRLTARGCLPDITDDAVVNAEAGTVTVLYNKTNLVREFSAVIVSEPITVTLVSAASIGILANTPQGALAVFDSVDDFQCGASAGYTSVQNDPGYDISLGLGRVSIDQLSPGGSFPSTILTVGIPDGSRMELLPGAQVIYVHVEGSSDPGTGAPNYHSAIVARAPVSVDGHFTTDRVIGPQPVAFLVDAATMCPGSDVGLTTSYIAVFVVGQWIVSAPDGTVTTIDSATSWR